MMIFLALIVSVFRSHYATIEIKFNAHSFNECLRHLSYPEIVFLLGLFTMEQIMLTRTAYHACAIGIQFESNSNAAT